MAKSKGNKNKKVLPVFHIFCEGEKTEPYYIKGYLDRYHSDKKRIVTEPTKKNTPEALVDEAVDHKKRSPDDDIYWVVYDREAVTKYSYELHLKALIKAKDNGIEIAFSNVCFEVWLSLHLAYSTASSTNCGAHVNKSPLKPFIKSKKEKKYEKALPSIFTWLNEDNGVSRAIKNAEKLRLDALSNAVLGKTSPCYLNPYTDVHELFIDMKMFIDGNVSVRKTRPTNFSRDIKNHVANNAPLPHPF